MTNMKNNQPVTPPSTKPGKPLAGFGGGEAANFYNPPGHVETESDLHTCSGVSLGTVYPPDGSAPITSTGVFAYPC